MDESEITTGALKALASVIIMAVVILRGWDKGKMHDEPARGRATGAAVLGVVMALGGGALIWAGAGAVGWMGAGLGVLLILRAR